MLQQTSRQRVSEHCLDLLFREARTYYGWLPKPVCDAQLRELYELARMPPTSSNISPQRIVFVVSQNAKERLRPGLKPGNVDKTMAAPVTAILGIDGRFFDHLERLAPHAVDKRAGYLADPDLATRAAFRNATLQGAYLLMAARALGLDCGPMSGVLHDVVDAEFFPGGQVRSNFLINIGHGDPTSVRTRAARFDFDDICQIL
ncbi:putative NADH dehydrogenase/NAD(P)H nitroreductase [Bosea sp. LC85]|uniref:malonic semialdehyde reductase n=1 Tax=Bosea sp. LC85 TaxID=1502851 RepID=UPI0004E290AC|nr:malonic semialdehyde reductase [Bosea sp. LC85]KFC70747.1 putative NADH dehydrogenase/NAD(P)H nitroreductase [Bosea sp. LC85]